MSFIDPPDSERIRHTTPCHFCGSALTWGDSRSGNLKQFAQRVSDSILLVGNHAHRACVDKTGGIKPPVVTSPEALKCGGSPGGHHDWVSGSSCAACGASVAAAARDVLIETGLNLSILRQSP